MPETLLQVEFQYFYPDGRASSVCHDDGELIDVTPIVCIAMYLQAPWTHNVSPAVLAGHKPDTSKRSNTFTPPLLHGAFESSPTRFSFNHLTRKPMFAETHSPEVETMKLVQSLIIAAVVSIPAVSFAQSNESLTRADVRAQLIQLEKAGYNPASDQTQYPKNIEAAQARIDAANGVSARSYGSSTGGTAAAGSRATDSDVIGLGSIYARP